MERVDARQRAKLFRITLESTPVGGIIRCTGLDDDLLCSNLKARDRADCLGCGAIDLLGANTKITASEGIINKISSYEELI